MSNAYYEMDKIRYPQKQRGGILQFIYFFRKEQSTNSKIMKKIYRNLMKPYQKIHGLEISDKLQIGGGFYIGHPYNITINSETIIGKNVNIHKGVTIGQENRGKRKGCPVIGDKVWIGVNATIVGAVTIGDDVLIAPNSYVNCDIPSHSVVYGNPCIIKHRDDATKGYVV